MQDERLNLPSASSVERVVNCPGSLNVIASLPKQIEQTSAVATFGDDVHKALEEGIEFEEGDDREIIRKRLADMESDAVIEWCAISNYDPMFTVREQRMFMRDRKTLTPIASAKVDVAHIMNGNRAFCCDYKTGFLPVTPSDRNWQMRTQAVCLWHEYPDVESVRVGVAAYRLKAVLDLTDYTLDDLKRAEFQLVVAFERAKEPDAPRFAGTWCRYCPAKLECREHRAWMMAEVSVIPANENQFDVIQRVRELPPEDLARIYRKKGIMDMFIDAVTARLKSMDETQLAAIGLKKKPGADRRTVTNKDAIITTLLCDMTSDELMDKMSLPISTVDELVGKTRKIKDKIEIKKKVAELFGTCIEEKRDADKLEEL